MKTDFFNWYTKTAEEYKGLVNPAAAAKLIGISTQHLNRIVEMGRITKHYYEDMPFIGITEVFEEIKRREVKENNKKEPWAQYIPFIYPKQELNDWLKEFQDEQAEKKILWNSSTHEEMIAFLDKKLAEWKKANPERAKKLAERLIEQIKGTYDPI